jgi:hypothetical protein
MQRSDLELKLLALEDELYRRGLSQVVDWVEFREPRSQVESDGDKLEYLCQQGEYY